jgi:hypothetical protein
MPFQTPFASDHRSDAEGTKKNLVRVIERMELISNIPAINHTVSI